MPKESATRHDFEQLLTWLDPDREVAGQIYEELRVGLIKIFGWNRCDDREGMADETFERVARQAAELIGSFKGGKKAFFYAVANNQIKEYYRKAKNQVSLEGLDIAEPDSKKCEEETAQMREDCLHKCLQDLRPEDRDLILAYYGKAGQARIKGHAEMAAKLGIPGASLRVRMYRLRTSLAECIEHCLDETKR